MVRQDKRLFSGWQNNFSTLFGLCPLHDIACASRAKRPRRQGLCYERIENQDGCGAIKDRELVSNRALELQGTLLSRFRFLSIHQVFNTPCQRLPKLVPNPIHLMWSLTSNRYTASLVIKKSSIIVTLAVQSGNAIIPRVNIAGTRLHRGPVR